MCTGRKILFQIRQSPLRIKQLENQIDEIYFELLPSGMRYDLDKVQSSPQNKMESLIIKAQEYREKLIDEKLELTSMKDQATECMRDIDINRRTAIEFYFFEGLTEEKAAAKMFMSERNFRHIKKKAIADFEKVWFEKHPPTS